MPRVQWPPVIRLYESPRLPRHPRLNRIIVDVFDRSPDVVRMIEEHLPPTAAPHAVIGCASARIANRLCARALKVPDHVLRLIAVLAYNEVRVIGHHGTCVDRVFPVDGARKPRR
jgi:hypothetical protein